MFQSNTRNTSKENHLHSQKKNKQQNAILDNMKISNLHDQRHYLIYFMIISLSLAGLLLPFSAYSGNTMASDAVNQSSTPINITETQIADRNIALQQQSPTRKKVLVNDSRGLSVFFMLGIAINIIMAVTFAWWFSKEWRRSK